MVSPSHINQVYYRELTVANFSKWIYIFTGLTEDTTSISYTTIHIKLLICIHPRKLECHLLYIQLNTSATENCLCLCFSCWTAPLKNLRGSVLCRRAHNQYLIDRNVVYSHSTTESQCLSAEIREVLNNKAKIDALLWRVSFLVESHVYYNFVWSWEDRVVSHMDLSLSLGGGWGELGLTTQSCPPLVLLGRLISLTKNC